MSLDSIDPLDDGQEITIGAGDTAGQWRYIEVVDAGAGTKKLKVLTAQGETRTFTVYDKWAKALKVLKVFGSGAGTTVTLVQVFE